MLWIFYCMNVLLEYFRVCIDICDWEYGITCIVHTSNFSTFGTHKTSYKWQINMKLANIVELLIFYHSKKFQVCMLFSVVVMDIQIWKSGYINYAHFLKSSHIYIPFQCFGLLNFLHNNYLEQLECIYRSELTRYICILLE